MWGCGVEEPVYMKQSDFPSSRGIEKNNLMVREALFPQSKIKPHPNIRISDETAAREILQPTERFREWDTW